MRISVPLLGIVALAACKEPANTAFHARPASAPTASASSGTPASVPTDAVPSASPLFVYAEGTDELAFWPPTTLRLVRAGSPPKTCMSELSTGADNMWTGPDVENAFADPDVQLALARGTRQSFLPEIDDAGVMTEGVLTTTKTSLEWKLKPCHWCVPPPAGITRLHRLLAAVMMNRRLLCPK
jgi:hypothetical protein